MTDIKVRVGQLIRETRKSKRLTQKELGVIMGVGEPTINGYEGGKQNLTIETLKKIADALKVEVNTFFK